MGYKFYAPTRVLFGAGYLNKLHDQALPGKRALLVISSGKSTRATGLLDRVEGELTQAGVSWALFDQVEANPVKSTVMAGAGLAKAEGCDFVLALGGGSVMDAAKAMAFMATNPGDLWDYVAGGTGKAQRALCQPLPVLCITTTAGTGSEVDPWGVVTNEDTHEKIGFGSGDRLLPVLAIVDPELMVTVPPKFTAFQGFDALFHSTEGYLSKAANLMSDMVTLTAIEHVAGNLAQAVACGSDLAAREKVAFANTLSGYAMMLSSCVSEHSMAHAMSALYPDLPHGAGLIMISQAYYQYFVDRHVCDERFVRMAKAMGVEDAKEPQEFVDALVRLQETCGVSDLKMSDYGISADSFEALAVNARETMGGLFSCDRVALSHEDCVAILKAAYR